MDDYPILVERLDKHQATRAICQTCGRETDVDVGQAGYADGEWRCEAEGCEGWVCFKYWPADHKCPNCGKLGFFEGPLAPCCSRRCQLQADYSAVLAERAPIVGSSSEGTDAG